MPETIDVLIVGGGFAGLTAGALLARGGRKVALFEKHSKLGGYAQYFGQPPFDSATHLIGDCGPNGTTRAILAQAGALDRVELGLLDPAYAAVFPNQRYSAPTDPERMRLELSTLWPGEADGIKRFLQDVDQLGEEYSTLPNEPAPDSLLARCHDLTLSGFLDGYSRNEEVRAALSVLWLFAGLPPHNMSAAYYAYLWRSFHSQGPGYVKGGVRNLSQALADVITQNGGTVENNMAVTRITRNRGWVTGAQVADGREFLTRAVIATNSPHDTFEELLSAEGQTSAGYPPLRSYATSVSAITAHLLVNGPVEPPARTTLIHSTYDLSGAYIDIQRSEPEYSALVCSVLDHGDIERVPEGKHLVSLFSLAPYSRYDNWEVPWDLRRTKEYRTLPDYVALKKDLGDELIRQAETVLPGLSEHAEVVKIGTPITMERYTWNTGGAAFGWANVVSQSGLNRPGNETTFQGLFVAGQWSFPGGTVAGAIDSGRRVADLLLNAER